MQVPPAPALIEVIDPTKIRADFQIWRFYDLSLAYLLSSILMVSNPAAV
jgi:hypothetical protein